RSGSTRPRPAWATPRRPPLRWSASPPTWGCSAAPTCRRGGPGSSTAAPAGGRVGGGGGAVARGGGGGRTGGGPRGRGRGGRGRGGRGGAAGGRNYKPAAAPAGVKDFTGGQGVQVWYETQREPDFVRTVGLLARRGRMVIMAGRQAQPVFPVGPFYTKDLAL